MLHTLKVKMVTRKLPTHDSAVFHKVYQYSPDLFKCRGVKDLDKHIEMLITEDIEKFKQKFVEFKQAEFIIHDMPDEDVVYLN